MDKSREVPLASREEAVAFIKQMQQEEAEAAAFNKVAEDPVTIYQAAVDRLEELGRPIEVLSFVEVLELAEQHLRGGPASSTQP